MTLRQNIYNTVVPVRRDDPNLLGLDLVGLEVEDLLDVLDRHGDLLRVEEAGAPLLLLVLANDGMEDDRELAAGLAGQAGEVEHRVDEDRVRGRHEVVIVIQAGRQAQDGRVGPTYTQCCCCFTRGRTVDSGWQGGT